MQNKLVRTKNIKDGANTSYTTFSLGEESYMLFNNKMVRSCFIKLIDLLN